MKKERIGFFKRVYLSITDFRIYPFIQREKTITAILYFLKLLMMLSLISTVVIVTFILNITNIVSRDFDNIIPKYKLENGVLDVSETINISNNGNIFVINTNMTNEEYKNTNSVYELERSNLFILITKDSIEYGNQVMSERLNFVKSDIILTQESLRDIVTKISEDNTVKIIIAVTTFASILFAYIILKFASIAVTIIVSYIISMLFRIKLKFSNHLRLVLYSLTLPIIIEFLALILTGNVPQFAYITYNILSYVYIYYAVRALKLDNLIFTSLSIDKNKREINIQQLIKQDILKRHNKNDKKEEVLEEKSDNSKEEKGENDKESDEEK